MVTGPRTMGLLASYRLERRAARQTVWPCGDRPQAAQQPMPRRKKTATAAAAASAYAKSAAAQWGH